MFKKLVSGLLIATSMLMAGAAGAQQVLFKSTFDSDTEGWRAFNSGPGLPLLPVSWSAVNGGQLEHSAPSEGYLSLFLAPASILSALHGAIQGGIAYDIGSSDSNKSTVFVPTIADISVYAGGVRIRSGLFANAPSPSLERVSLRFDTSSPWTFFDGVTETVATQANIDYVLLNARDMSIRAEYWNSNTPDQSYLDNVVITSAVPEVETLSMILAGLCLVGFASRRKQQVRA
jgi:hypothetical protein